MAILCRTPEFTVGATLGGINYLLTTYPFLKLSDDPELGRVTVSGDRWETARLVCGKCVGGKCLIPLSGVRPECCRNEPLKYG